MKIVFYEFDLVEIFYNMVFNFYWQIYFID